VDANSPRTPNPEPRTQNPERRNLEPTRSPAPTPFDKLRAGLKGDRDCGKCVELSNRNLRNSRNLRNFRNFRNSLTRRHSERPRAPVALKGPTAQANVNTSTRRHATRTSVGVSGKWMLARLAPEPRTLNPEPGTRNPERRNLEPTRSPAPTPFDKLRAGLKGDRDCGKCVELSNRNLRNSRNPQESGAISEEFPADLR